MRRYGHLAGQPYWLEYQSKRGVGREGRGLVSLTKGSGFILKTSQESFQKEMNKPCFLFYQVKALEKTTPIRVAPSPAKGTPGKGATPAAPGKAGPLGKPEEDSESSSEESDSEEETQAVKTPVQVGPGERAPELAPTPGGLLRADSPTPRALATQGPRGVCGVFDPVCYPVSSSPLSGLSPLILFLSLQAKPSGKIPQVKAASAAPTQVLSPKKGAPPAPTGKAGPAATQAQPRKQEKEESSSSSSEESDSEGEAPTATRQTTSLAQVRLEDAQPRPGSYLQRPCGPLVLCSRTSIRPPPLLSHLTRSPLSLLSCPLSLPGKALGEKLSGQSCLSHGCSTLGEGHSPCAPSEGKVCGRPGREAGGLGEQQ